MTWGIQIPRRCEPKDDVHVWLISEPEDGDPCTCGMHLLNESLYPTNIWKSK